MCFLLNLNLFLSSLFLKFLTTQSEKLNFTIAFPFSFDTHNQLFIFDMLLAMLKTPHPFSFSPLCMLLSFASSHCLFAILTEPNVQLFFWQAHFHTQQSFFFPTLKLKLSSKQHSQQRL